MAKTTMSKLEEALLRLTENVNRLEQEGLASRQEMDRQVLRLSKEMGRLSNKMGTLVEDMVSPDMLRILRQIANIPEDDFGTINVRVQQEFKGNKLNGHPPVMELDAIAKSGNYVLINETKATFRPEYVTHFLEKLAMIRDYFPEFTGKQVYAAIASLRIDPSLAKHAHDEGLLVLSLAEGMLEWQNPPGFVPKVF